MRGQRVSSVAGRRLAGVAVLAAAVAAAISVHAYVVSGYTWASHQVDYYINPSNLDGLPASTVETSVGAGANAWGTQSNADFQFYYAGRTTGSTVGNNGKNEVFFRNESNGSTAGVTYWWYDGTGHLIDFDILFYDGGFTFFAGTTGCSGGLYLEDIAAHEFGHALGLRHTSVSGATMTPTTSYCSQNWRSLEADDVAGVEALYPPAGSPPSAPTGAAASTSTVSDPSSQIRVTWVDASSNEDYFFVERSADQVSWLQFRVAANTTSYTDAGLEGETVYYYRVRANNSAGNSPYSNTASAKTSAAATTAPSVPTNPYPSNGATGVNENSDLSWVGNARSYDVYFWPSAQAKPSAPYSTGLASPFLSLPRLNQATKYSWQVVARNGALFTTGTTWTFTTRTKSKP